MTEGLSQKAGRSVESNEAKSKTYGHTPDSEGRISGFQCIAQFGRVLALEASCRWFKSIYTDQYNGVRDRLFVAQSSEIFASFTLKKLAYVFGDRPTLEGAIKIGFPVKSGFHGLTASALSGGTQEEDAITSCGKCL